MGQGKRVNRYGWVSLFVLAAGLAGRPALSADTKIGADPRFLSKIEIPSDASCTSDASNDGRLLVTICDSKTEKDGVTPVGLAKIYIHDISDLRTPRQVSEAEIG